MRENFLRNKIFPKGNEIYMKIINIDRGAQAKAK